MFLTIEFHCVNQALGGSQGHLLHCLHPPHSLAFFNFVQLGTYAYSPFLPPLSVRLNVTTLLLWLAHCWICICGTSGKTNVQRLPKGRGEDEVHVYFWHQAHFKVSFCAFESLHRYVMLDLKLIIQWLLAWSWFLYCLKTLAEGLSVVHLYIMLLYKWSRLVCVHLT